MSKIHDDFSDISTDEQDKKEPVTENIHSVPQVGSIHRDIDLTDPKTDEQPVSVTETYTLLVEPKVEQTHEDNPHLIYENLKRKFESSADYTAHKPTIFDKTIKTKPPMKIQRVSAKYTTVMTGKENSDYESLSELYTSDDYETLSLSPHKSSSLTTAPTSSDEEFMLITTNTYKGRSQNNYGGVYVCFGYVYYKMTHITFLHV